MNKINVLERSEHGNALGVVDVGDGRHLQGRELALHAGRKGDDLARFVGQEDRAVPVEGAAAGLDHLVGDEPNRTSVLVGHVDLLVAVGEEDVALGGALR